MANPFFKFKQFTVWHDQCAMKVGTDGVLLGALAPVSNKTNLLDIGTGTGLVALMMAQRNLDAQITALEIDYSATKQAQFNFDQSPWEERIKLTQTDFKLYQTNQRYDLIVSNPPYFVDSLLSHKQNKNVARHTVDLSFKDLLYGVARLLQPDGHATFIIPTDAQEEFINLAQKMKLHLIYRVNIQTRPGLEPKRVVLTFGNTQQKLVEESLLIELERHIYSEEYISITKDFYLKF